MFFSGLSCFFDDPADVGSLISGYSAFSKTILNIRKFTVHALLKPGLENFEHYFTSIWDGCNCLPLPFLWIGMKTDLFQCCCHCWVFQICWHITQVLWPPHAKSWLFGKDSCWEGLGARGEGDDRGWDGQNASLTQWTWVWVNSIDDDGQGGLACCDSRDRK